MDHLEILTTNDADRWDEALHQVGRFDFYYLAKYHRLMEDCGRGRAVMPVYRDGETVIAFPMLVRAIEETNLNDAASAPGFIGPIVSRMRIPSDTPGRFLDQLHDYFAAEKIIAVFSTLHPLVSRPSVLRAGGDVVDLGQILSIDLTIPPELQYRQYRENHRRQIRHLREKGLTCRKVGIEHLDDFVSILYQTMDRVEAERGNYFDRAYFEYLMREMPQNMHLFICEDNETVVSAGMFAHCCDIVSYYMGGTPVKYLPESPMKLLLDHVREWGNRMHACEFHIGLGVGGQQDTVYGFKAGFGGREYPRLAWRYVANPDAYSEVCSRFLPKAPTIMDDGSGYFPAYRNPDLEVIRNAA